ncbi:MAG: phosphatidylglycerophosphatase A [Acidimicrobiia bacterium]
MRRFIATGFGVGLIPRRLWGSDNGAGTFGATVGALIGLALWTAPWWADAAAAVLFFAASWWAANPLATDHADPGWVTIDEVAGTLIAVVGLTGWPWLVALVVARLGDIYKVLPGVAAAERLEGGLGVTADDAVAGIYGLGAGWLLVLIL